MSIYQFLYANVSIICGPIYVAIIQNCTGCGIFSNDIPKNSFGSRRLFEWESSDRWRMNHELYHFNSEIIISNRIAFKTRMRTQLGQESSPEVMLRVQGGDRQFDGNFFPIV